MNIHPLHATSICYLCGKEIAEDDISSGDHVIPQLLITRAQPKAKGFDYGNKLPSHEKCNNEFDSENYCVKALKLIEVLNDESCVSKLQHATDQSIKVMIINQDCLKELTQRDLRFFKFIDVRNKSISELETPSFFTGKPKTNPIRDALFVALSVLTKSAAALLIKRYLHAVPSQWNVLAIPYSGATEKTDLDNIFGDTKPFDIGVKVWIRHFDTEHWFALYRAQNVLVFFLFRFSKSETIWNGMIDRFPDAEHLIFQGDHLNELINYQWQKSSYRKA